MPFEEILLKGGGIAGAISAILGLLWKYVVNPFIVSPRKRRKEEAARERERTKNEEIEYRNKVFEKLDALSEILNDTQKDVGYLQMHELKSAHSRLMIQGWCSDGEKAGVIDLYDRYKSKGRNSLAESFADDILSLPPYPPEKE